MATNGASQTADLLFQFSVESYKRENLDKAKKALDALYSFVTEKIAITKGKKPKKPMLILIGEDHESAFSAFAEIVCITAAIEFGIKHFLREEDESRNAQINACMHRYLAGENGYSLPWRYQNPPLFSRVFLYHLKMSFQMIDLGADSKSLIPYKDKTPPPGSSISTVEGIKYRNNVMAEEFKQFANQDLFAIVGSDHLYGLANEEGLAEQYELVLFDSSKIGDFDLPEGSYAQIWRDFRKTRNNLYNLFFQGQWNMCIDEADLEVMRDSFITKCKAYLSPASKQNDPSI